MSNVLDRDLVLADDGRQHTPECVTQGWWLLDWDADCVTEGVPPGGPVAAQAERALFSTAIAVLNVVVLLIAVMGGVRRGR